jgi:hypothetical protein
VRIALILVLTLCGCTAAEPPLGDFTPEEAPLERLAAFARPSRAAPDPLAPLLVVHEAGNPWSSWMEEILLAGGLPASSWRSVELSAEDEVPPGITTARLLLLAVSAPSARLDAAVRTRLASGLPLLAVAPSTSLQDLFGVRAVAEGAAITDLTTTPAGRTLLGGHEGPLQLHAPVSAVEVVEATVLAFFEDPATGQSRPVVTHRPPEDGRGEILVFHFDLARSLALTRQGNPEWAGVETDGMRGLRSTDLFFPWSADDSVAPWVDLDRVHVPQADEMQRLLLGALDHLAGTAALPRFEPLPFGHRVAVVLTGDDHGNGGTAGRVERLLAADPPGCVVDTWGCPRASFYIYPDTPLEPGTVQEWASRGFEFSLHLDTGGDWAPEDLGGLWDEQSRALAQRFPGLPAPQSQRVHAVAWSDWDSIPRLLSQTTARLDMNYY